MSVFEVIRRASRLTLAVSTPSEFSLKENFALKLLICWRNSLRLETELLLAQVLPSDLISILGWYWFAVEAVGLAVSPSWFTVIGELEVLATMICA